MGKVFRGVAAVTASLLMSAVLAVAGTVAVAVADPPPDPVGHEPPPPRLPMVVPTASDWEPKFPPPYDQSRRHVTDADIAAQREMCQWFTEQYGELLQQIDRFNIKLISRHGNWAADDVMAHADAVTANIDQSVAFLTPRAQALTQTRTFAGDNYFPLYQGESFYLMWQHLSNVSAGIRGRQPAWFTGPSVQRFKYWGSRINRSQVCR
ncbi:hypothetical protein H7I53_07920 [Mycolicibacterium pulveris]|uniref:Uncharacterized protein n=1 Tax=Mycolicibacterium pulveris TaxID=36813 RepID=A0A7I7UJ72_MYCPV|nr:hypothetical protein [Mycolicibacterium pulveris]MCV6980147.1 hypothetical protein [Mycolicibacterium pulveris]BBY81528.1 hypothetical protein MPUL_26860 [Mycolicibacterium pulveris]